MFEWIYNLLSLLCDCFRILCSLFVNSPVLFIIFSIALILLLVGFYQECFDIKKSKAE